MLIEFEDSTSKYHCCLSSAGSKIVLISSANDKSEREKGERGRLNRFLLLLLVLSFNRGSLIKKVAVHLIDETFISKIPSEYLIMWSLNRQKSSSTVNKYFSYFRPCHYRKTNETKALFFFTIEQILFSSFCKGSFSSSSSFVCSYDFLLMFSKQTSIMSMCREREREKMSLTKKKLIVQIIIHSLRLSLRIGICHRAK